jgi:hypothetical protein
MRPLLVHEVLDRETKAVFRGSARYASQVFDRGTQADARGATLVLGRVAQTKAHGGARCASQGCIHLSWCPSRCPRRHSFCVVSFWSLRLAVARGAAQVIARGAQAADRGGALCASQVLGRGALADPRDAARCASQVLVR